MITHIVGFRWTDEATPEQKELVATELRGLRPLMTGSAPTPSARAQAQPPATPTSR
jgi:hypothetical protein